MVLYLQFRILEFPLKTAIAVRVGSWSPFHVLHYPPVIDLDRSIDTSYLAGKSTEFLETMMQTRKK
jgi:hypothetical protein